MAKPDELLEKLRQRQQNLKAKVSDVLEQAKALERKTDQRRKVKGGVLLFEMLARDPSLSLKAESLAKTFFTRPLDIQDFELDQPTNWFAKQRALKEAEKADAKGIAASAQRAEAGALQGALAPVTVGKSSGSTVAPVGVASPAQAQAVSLINGEKATPLPAVSSAPQASGQANKPRATAEAPAARTA